MKNQTKMPIVWLCAMVWLKRELTLQICIRDWFCRCRLIHGHRSSGSGGLETGSTFIWLCVVSAGLNVDSFTMTASPVAPTPAPTTAPTTNPTPAPTPAPSTGPTGSPTAAPTAAPTVSPTRKITPGPTTAPSPAPTTAPTPAPTTAPTPAPTLPPTLAGPSEAYGGVPASIPGIIEAEEFDYGGEGVGYSDTTTSNTGGVSYACLFTNRRLVTSIILLIV